MCVCYEISRSTIFIGKGEKTAFSEKPYKFRILTPYDLFLHSNGNIILIQHEFLKRRNIWSVESNVQTLISCPFNIGGGEERLFLEVV